MLEGTDGVCDKCGRHRHAQPSWEQAERTCVLTTESRPEQVTNACLKCGLFTPRAAIKRSGRRNNDLEWVHLCPWKYSPVVWIFYMVLLKITFCSRVIERFTCYLYKKFNHKCFFSPVKSTGVKDNGWHHFLQESEAKILRNESAAFLNRWHHLENSSCSWTQEVAVSHEAPPVFTVLFI